MTTLLELQDEVSWLTLIEGKEKLFLYVTNEHESASFNLTKDQARLLIESIQSYFQIT